MSDASLYSLVRPLLFKMDPEDAHERAMRVLAWLSGRPGLLRAMSWTSKVVDPRLQTRRFGLTFDNPLGLAAGFDKNALAVPVWPALGFGFVELGTITALSQPGNPRPRLFRLPEESALINRMGFNNDGAEAVAKRLARLTETGLKPEVPLGVNLGKSQAVPLEDAADDYLRSLACMWRYADYFAINVSSPNTPGLRDLQDRTRLEDLLGRLTACVDERARSNPPRRALLVKIAPDLSWRELDDVLELALAFKLAGLIAVNTTVSRSALASPVAEPGGLSGRPLASRSLEMLRYIRKQTGGQLEVVSVGGVFSADDVYERLKAGACLVQLYTSFVYEGPLLIRRLAGGLLARMERDGVADIEALIGAAG